MNNKYIITAIFLSIIAVGIFFRIYQFPNLPGGLQQDEISSFIESTSLLETGMDRWGNKLPVYFASWGSGQNVLSSYLLIPFTLIFGYSTLAIRLMPLLLYILSIFLFYWLLQKWFGKPQALIGSAILATNPWHILAARWGLESNLLPIFVLLGLCTFTNAIESPSKKNIYLSLIPFALCFYAYSITLVTLPIVLVGIAIIFKKDITANWKNWVVALGFFILTLFPFLLWVIKNYITKAALPLESLLPFSVHLFSASRLEQARGGRTTIFTDNIDYYINGIKDTLPFNSIGEFGIFYNFSWIFLWIGIVCCFFLIRSKYIKILLVWLASGLTLLWIVPLNVNRNNIIYFPIIILMSIGIYQIYINIQNLNFQRTFLITVTSVYLVSSILFGYFYFVLYPTKFSFPDLQKPFAELSKLPPNYLITNRIELPYIYTLFHTKYPIASFQKEAVAKGFNTSYSVPQFGPYYFDSNLIRSSNQPYSFLLEKEAAPCSVEIILYQDKSWKVGQCK